MTLPRKATDPMLDRLHATIHTLTQCNRALVKATDESSLLRQICANIVAGGYVMAWVGYVTNDQEQRIIPQAHAGKESGYLDDIYVSARDDSSGQSAISTAVRTGRTVIQRDIPNYLPFAPWREEALRRGYKSVAALPLRDDRDQVLGGLAVYATEADAFDEDETELLDQLADDLAYGITNLRAKSALQESENRYRGMFENHPAVKLVIDPKDGQIVDANPSACKFYGYSRDQLRSMKIGDINILPPDQIERKMGTTVGQNGGRFEFSHQLASGEIRQVEVHSGPFEIDGRKLLYSTIHDISEQFRTRDLLRKTSQAVEQSPSLVVITDRSGAIEYVNQRFVDVTGYERHEVLGQNPRILQGGETSAEEYAQLWATITSGQVWRGQFHNRKKNGDLYWEQAAISPIKNEDGEITHFVALKEDITLRKTIEQQEQEQRALAEALRNISMILTSTLDLKHVMERIIDSVGQVVPHDAANIQIIEGDAAYVRYWRGYDDSLSEYFAGKAHPLTLTGIQKAILTGRTDIVYDTRDVPDWIALPGDAWVRSCLGAPIRIQGRTIGFLNLDSREPRFFTEVDGERLEAFASQAAIAIENARLYEEIRAYTAELEDRVAERTRALRAAVDHVEAILANSSDAILILTADGRIVQSNPAFYRMFDCDEDEAVQPSIQSLIVPEHVEALTNAMTAALETRQSQRVEVMALREGDLPFYADVAFADISQNEDTRILCSLHDISELKRAEYELIGSLNKEKELNELKTRFISMVSHEFRTPLASIRLSTDLLDQYSARMTDERRAEHLHKIQAQVAHLTSLMEDVLTIGRADSGPTTPTLVPIDVESLFGTLIDDVQQTCFATHRLKYTVDGPCGIPLLDEKLVRQILQNLLSNAVKYSPDGGDIDCTLTCRDDEMVITVTDHGIGIPDEDQPHLYEVFFRASNAGEISGTGLGMPITLIAVQALKGTIAFTSKQGEGTTFTVTLPC